MLNTYIKNSGIMKTIVHNNNDNHVNLINWDADYDGDVANIYINSNTDGKLKHYGVSLDNQDLANLLSIPSVDLPIDRRLKMDFQEPYYKTDPYPRVEIPTKNPQYFEEKMINRHISSPSIAEELIIPLTIDRKTADLFTLTPHKKHRRSKTHITHKVYKKHKSTPKTKTKSKSSRRKTIPNIELL
jgi:hypothetical protein